MGTERIVVVRARQTPLEPSRHSSARTVGELSEAAHLISGRTKCHEIERLFAENKEVTSVVVRLADGREALLDRAAFEYELYGGRGFGRWILESTPVESLVHASATLELDMSMSIRAAFEALLHREREQRFHDILVTAHPGPSLRLRAVDLLEAVATQHSYDATHDPLTGLGNRLHLLQRLEVLTFREEPTALLFIDLDRFKVINDSLGHPAGDTLLALFAERLSRTVRSSDTTARLGGDEFAVVVKDHSDDAHTLALRLLEDLRAPFPIGGASVMVNVSIGIVTSEPGDDAASLLRKADVAMYEAKGAGGNTFRDFHGDLGDAAKTRLDIEMALRDALANKSGLVLHYQPVVDLQTNHLVGFEALVRGVWDDETWMPDVFLPIAEETGLIVAIDRWVMETAAMQLATWRTQLGRPDLRMSVNVSPRDLEDPDFVRQMETVMGSAGLDAGTLVFELTEGSLMRSMRETVPVLERLRARGVWFAIDDFGTGYSSLNQLCKLPVDVLKVDRAFVEAASTGAQEEAIVKLIVALARAMGVHVVAEGVETSEQATHLASLGCRFAQGYYFAAPLPAEQVNAWLAERLTVAA